MTYFHEEQRFRSWWVWALLALAVIPIAFVLGGWGVHYSWNGWLFNTSGHVGVLVETNDGARTMIGSQRAAELEAAIARAVSERGGR